MTCFVLKRAGFHLACLAGQQPIAEVADRESVTGDTWGPAGVQIVLFVEVLLQGSVRGVSGAESSNLLRIFLAHRPVALGKRGTRRRAFGACSFGENR